MVHHQQTFVGIAVGGFGVHREKVYAVVMGADLLFLLRAGIRCIRFVGGHGTGQRRTPRDKCRGGVTGGQGNGICTAGCDGGESQQRGE